MCIGDGAIFGLMCSVQSLAVVTVSTVKIPVQLANLYRLQPVATDSKKTKHSVSTVLVVIYVAVSARVSL